MATQDHDLHACFLAALLLHDAGVPTTGDKMKTILDASNNSDIQLVYCNIVAKFLEVKNVPSMLTQMASGLSDSSKGGEVGWDMLSDASVDLDKIDCGNREDFSSDDDGEGFMDLFS